MDGDSQERDALYEQAERLSNSLATMGQQLREAVEVSIGTLQRCNFLSLQKERKKERKKEA